MLPMTALSLQDIRRLAAELAVDPRSVQAEIEGRRVRGMAGDRIRRALAARGVASGSSPTPNMLGIAATRGGRML